MFYLRVGDIEFSKFSMKGVRDLHTSSTTVPEQLDTQIPASVPESVATLFSDPIKKVIPTVDERYRRKPSGTSDQGHSEDSD